jgi:2-aminoadipate transaminase
VLSLAGGLPAPELLPVSRIAEATARVLAPRTVQYSPTEGMAELRAVTGADLVTTGSQQAIDLVARAVLDPGDGVALASPAYLGAVQAFEACGARLVPVRSDADGLDTDALAAVLSTDAGIRLVYVVPNFHNPSGARLSTERRRHLSTLSDRFGVVVIADDPYGALTFDGVTLPDVEGERVVQLRSASKVLAPGLRVGWITGPPEIVNACVKLKQAVDLHTSTLDQAIVADLLADRAWFDAHVARVRDVYAMRARALSHALTTQFENRIELSPVHGGMFTWVRWPGVDTAQLAADALRADTAFVPGIEFSLDRRTHTDEARLCHATLTQEQLTTAVTRLGQSVTSERRTA